MSDKDDRLTIQLIASRKGEDFVRSALSDIYQQPKSLTIIANEGIHPIPSEFVFGDLHIASTGTLDFSTVESVNRELDIIVLDLKNKLMEDRWEKVYLLPFGHSVVCMNIKMTVFRVLRIETTDIFYFGAGKYGLIERDTRLVMTS